MRVFEKGMEGFFFQSFSPTIDEGSVDAPR